MTPSIICLQRIVTGNPRGGIWPTWNGTDLTPSAGFGRPETHGDLS